MPHATNRRQAIDAAEIRRLYVEEAWPMARLAARFACSETTIKRRLADLDIAPRRRGPTTAKRSANQPITWSPELAYAVGAIATDGNLSPDQRHLSFVSKDRDWLEVLATCLNLSNAITTSRAHGRTYYRLQWGDRTFYDWLTTIGLKPAKSRALGPLAVPDEHFADFLRGCIDGDGSIQAYTDRYMTSISPKYVYQRLFVSLVSASPAFLTWVQATAHIKWGITGALFSRAIPSSATTLWILKYAKRESINLLRALYYQLDVPCLRRKYHRALPYLMNELDA